jgi:hypothetical protein
MRASVVSFLSVVLAFSFLFLLLPGSPCFSISSFFLCVCMCVCVFFFVFSLLSLFLSLCLSSAFGCPIVLGVGSIHTLFWRVP